jgi:hypothetical protein
MDIRCSHCGADEAVYAAGQWDENPRILVSTALGAMNGNLTRAMERGNFHRLITGWTCIRKTVMPKREQAVEVRPSPSC